MPIIICTVQAQHRPSRRASYGKPAQLLACLLLVSSSVGSNMSMKPFVRIAKVPTRGAAGWANFCIDEQDYLAVANFFTSSPSRQPSMETDSIVYKVHLTADRSLKFQEFQHFSTVGAHGVEHFTHSGNHYLAIPNYYGGDTAIHKWIDNKFVETQRIKSDGAGSVEAFKIGEKQMLGIAEFNLGIAAIYKLQGRYFKLWQRIKAAGVGAMATLTVDNDDGGKQLLLITSSYVSKETGWQTRSSIFALSAAGTSFEHHHDVSTVGAHDVEVKSIADRHFVFFSNDKDHTTTLQDSELFEWVGGFPGGRLKSLQRVRTDGAHAADFFSSSKGDRHFLAVANLGDRQTNTYRRKSDVYELNVSAAKKPLTLVQRLSTTGATDFHAFMIGGVTFLAVSNEQDDELGGDIGSTIWSLQLKETTERDEL